MGINLPTFARPNFSRSSSPPASQAQASNASAQTALTEEYENYLDKLMFENLPQAYNASAQSPLESGFYEPIPGEDSIVVPTEATAAWPDNPNLLSSILALFQDPSQKAPKTLSDTSNLIPNNPFGNALPQTSEHSGESDSDYEPYSYKVGTTPANSNKERKARLAKKLGVGTTPADYNRYLKARLAKKLGVGTTPADYNRYLKAERAKKLGVGTTAADYNRYLKMERAKKLGVGTTAADYNRYRREMAKGFEAQCSS